MEVSVTPNRSSRPRHCETRTAGTTRTNSCWRASATANATYDLPSPTSSASRAPPYREMMALNRFAAGIWWGASQAGQVAGGVTLATDAPSSSARAAAQTTSRGAASPAGSSATARGSATGTRCSERIRGQRAAVGAIELEGIGDEIVGWFAAFAATRELVPYGRAAAWDR